MNQPILITGIPRSGGSVIGGVINICGAFGGKMTVGNTDCRGAYENIRIGNTLVKPYLLHQGADGDGQYPLPENTKIPPYWKQEVEQVMISEGYKKDNWMYKDSRIALMWRVWHNAFPDAKWIIVRRRTGDVVQSCMKTAFMKAFKDIENLASINRVDEESGWLWWVHEHEKRFAEMIVEGVNYRIIWPERMVDGDYRQLYEMLDWLDLKWKVEILGFIDSLLWGNRPRKEVLNGSKNNG